MSAETPRSHSPTEAAPAPADQGRPVAAGLSPAVCWEVYRIAAAEASGPITFRVETISRCVLHVAQPGTSRFNEIAVTRKIQTALALGKSTASWQEDLQAKGLTAATHPLVDDRLYTDIPGGIALEWGGEIVAAAAISGLTPAEDHRVLAHAMAQHDETCKLVQR